MGRMDRKRSSPRDRVVVGGGIAVVVLGFLGATGLLTGDSLADAVVAAAYLALGLAVLIGAGIWLWRHPGEQ